MSIEKIDQYIKELTAIKNYDNLKQDLAQTEKEIQNLKNALAIRDKEIANTKQELSRLKAHTAHLNEVKMIFDNNKNATTLAQAEKVFLNEKNNKSRENPLKSFRK
ncbi:MAG TPA: hypothetical protein VE619_00910 [Nitrososphaeraceae archaeon]|nr:hypothetical protein [Nitrososphaeraceae archaeon]